LIIAFFEGPPLLIRCDNKYVLLCKSIERANNESGGEGKRQRERERERERKGRKGRGSLRQK
jgi:hypothetical protein